MNTVKLILIFVLSASIVNSELISTEVNPEKDSRNDLDMNLLKVTLVAVKLGVTSKVANCNFDLKDAEDNLGKEEGIAQYKDINRGIILTDCSILNKDMFNRLVEKSGANYLILYRYIGKVEVVNDVLLGKSVVFSFKKGANKDDENLDISMTFGNAKVARKSSEDIIFSRISTSRVNRIRTVTKEFAKAHKNFLKEKVEDVIIKAREFDTYNSLYNEIVAKKNLSKEIPVIESNINKKTNECQEAEATYKRNNDAYEKEKELMDKTKEKIKSLQSENIELNSLKTQLEKEQAEANSIHDNTSQQILQVSKNLSNVEAAVLRIKNLSPDFFNGCSENCLLNNLVDSCCVERVRNIYGN